LDLYIARIERLNPTLNAIVTIDVDGARQRADELDSASTRGELVGPLHGLPVTVKDSFETAGMRSTGGSADLASYVPDRDAPAVAALRGAGAVIFGKTNLPTWSEDSQTKNPMFGRTLNPWSLDHSPGGSSGGSAAALAAGLTGAELGADTGGSVRIPASHSGVCGHKPSAGLVSTRGNLVYLDSQHSERDVEAAGPMTRTASDLALMLEVLATPSDHPHEVFPGLLPTRSGDLRGKRFAAWFDEPGHPVDHQVRNRLDEVVAAIRDAGGEVDEEARPAFGFNESCQVAIALAGAALAFAVPAEPAEDVVDPLERSMWMSHREWLTTQAQRREMQIAWQQYCSIYDAVLCPVSSTAATPHDDLITATRLVEVDGRLVPETVGTAWSVMSSGLGIPGTVVQAGRTSEGLPVGVMLLGAYCDDRTLISLAARVAELSGGYRIPPDFA
jgi:amidase